jgi:hypothetical protein
MQRERSWTVYIAQDKHLDYDWCGAESEIEARMATLVDGYLDLAETNSQRWNLDCALWLEVYRRQRGEVGAARLLRAIQRGLIGYGAQYNVMLWGLIGPELAARALGVGHEIERATGRAAHTALIMENAGMPWGVAQALADGGIRYLARGIYDLRGESYVSQRAPYPLFWWIAPDGSRLLTHWPLYTSTRTWGGYAEAGELLRLAGEGWDAFHLHRVGDRNTSEVYAARATYIAQTVARYEALGADYPVSHILLLGTGWDNWTITSDISCFIARYNAEQDDRIRLVDARYDEFFGAVEQELADYRLTLPEQRGSFGICWDEWAAHLAGYQTEFRRAERLLPRIEASLALSAGLPSGNGSASPSLPFATLYADAEASLKTAYDALLRFAEHDMGGCNLATAAIAAGNRAAATARALTIAHTLATPAQLNLEPDEPEAGLSRWRSIGRRRYAGVTSPLQLPWHGGAVVFDPLRCAVTSLCDGRGVEWVPSHACQGAGVGLGELIRTRYQGEGPFREVLPGRLAGDAQPCVDAVLQSRDREGVELQIQGQRWGMKYVAHWRFHHASDTLDVTYHLRGGWDATPQTVQVAFPLVLDAVEPPLLRYHHDSIGAIIAVGLNAEGGEELPGANPVLRALRTFAAVHAEPGSNGTPGAPRGAVLISPDAHLVTFGRVAIPAISRDVAAINSMPLMNLTRNDRQVWQGGRTGWTFRYRLVLERAPFDALRALRHAQSFDPPFPWLADVGPILSGIRALELDYTAGPLLSCRRIESQNGLALRFWNVLDQPAIGSLRLPQGYRTAERCDALGRTFDPLAIDEQRVRFTVPARGTATVALKR